MVKPKHDSQQPTISGTWSFEPEDKDDVPSLDNVTSPVDNIEPVKWTSPEFTHHAKPLVWYIYLGLATLAAAAGVYLLTKDTIATGVVIFCGIIFGIFSNRKPREVDYAVDSKGVTIGNKPYTYDSFKSFSIVDDGKFVNILLIPTKRFMPMLTVNFDLKNENKILKVLNDKLPLDDRDPGALDNFLHRIGY